MLSIIKRHYYILIDKDFKGIIKVLTTKQQPRVIKSKY